MDRESNMFDTDYLVYLDKVFKHDMVNVVKVYLLLRSENSMLSLDKAC